MSRRLIDVVRLARPQLLQPWACMAETPPVQLLPCVREMHSLAAFQPAPRVLSGPNSHNNTKGSSHSGQSAAASESARLWARLAALGLGTLALAPLAVHGEGAQPESSSPPPVAEAVKDPPLDPFAPPKHLTGVPRDVLLYQYEVCPFCCKVKAFLDFHKIPYRTVEVSPLNKKELKWSAYKKVPVVLLGEEPLNDSTLIITRLAAELRAASSSSSSSSAAAAAAAGEAGRKPRRSLWGGGGGGGGGGGDSTPQGAPEPGAAGARSEEERWRRWVDERFVRTVTVNIYRSAREALQTFEYIAETGKFGWAEREAARWVGAGVMWSLSGRLKRKYAIEGEPRAALYSDAAAWVEAVGARRFHGGDEPDLADISVFGVIRSVTGTDTFNDLMHATAIGPWYERMSKAVGPSARVAES